MQNNNDRKQIPSGQLNRGQGTGMGQGMGMGLGMGQSMSQHMGMEQGLFSSDADLINDISKAVILEVQAYNFYESLLDFIDNEQDRSVILRIQKDESKHYHWFTMILNMLGARILQIPDGELPTELTQGIKTAIQKEIDAQEFYQDISYRANTHPIQMHFMHAAQDEQRHATLLQNMLN